MNKCAVCGCTHFQPCIDPETEETCSWAGEDLCTFCVGLSVSLVDAPELGIVVGSTINFPPLDDQLAP